MRRTATRLVNTMNRGSCGKPPVACVFQRVQRASICPQTGNSPLHNAMKDPNITLETIRCLWQLGGDLYYLRNYKQQTAYDLMPSALKIKLRNSPLHEAYIQLEKTSKDYINALSDHYSQNNRNAFAETAFHILAQHPHVSYDQLQTCVSYGGNDELIDQRGKRVYEYRYPHLSSSRILS